MRVKVGCVVVSTLEERSTLYSGLWGLSQLRGKVSLEVVNCPGEWSSGLCGLSEF
jgi:hypothetical protein